MSRWLIGRSLKARRLVVALTAALIVVGVVQLGRTPVDALPEFEPPTVEVQTEALGLSAAEVEEFITVPLEQDLLNGVAFLQDIRSASLPGLSSIQMVFEPGTDLLDARQVVQERLAQAQTALPNVQTRPSQMLQPLSSTSRVMMIGLSSAQLSPIDLSILTRWTIGPRLLGVPGVANVAIWGFRDRQLQVLVDPDRLRQHGVSLQQIVDTTANSQFVCPLTFEECSTPGTGGIIETSNQRVGVQYVPVTATPKNLADVPIEDAAASGLTLGDVADITEDHQPLIGDAVGTDLMLVVQKFPAANTMEVTTGLEDAIAALRPGLSGVTIDSSVYRPASFLEDSRRNLALALLAGALLAILALVALMFDWRATVTTIASVLAALATAGAVLSFTDATLNAMSVTGLVMALVVVVHAATTDADAYARRARERRAAGEAPTTATFASAAMELRSAGAYALLITLAAVAPLYFVRGAFGTFFPSVATPFVIALVASILVALIVTPAVAAVLLHGEPRTQQPAPSRRLVSSFRSSLSRYLRSRIALAATLVVLLVAGLASLPFLGGVAVPSFKDTELLVNLRSAPSIALTEMQRVSALVADELRSLPGIAGVGAHVGRAITSDQVVGANAGQLWVSVDPDADYDATISAVDEVANGYPGLTGDVVTYPNARVDEVLPATEAPVTVRLYGQDFAVLGEEAAKVRTMLARIDGVENARVVGSPQEPTVEIEVDLARAQEHGIRPGDVRRAATALISGLTVGSLFEDQKVFEVVVWGTPAIRSDLPAVRRLLIDSPGGGHLRLGDVAQVRIAPAPLAIRHESVSRYADVVADVSGRDLGPVLDEVGAGLAGLRFPLEYHAELLGDQPQTQAASRRLAVLVVTAVLLIFLFLQVALGSWRLALLASAALLLALTGGLAATALTGDDVSIATAGGLLVVLAVAARQVLGVMGQYRLLASRPQAVFGDDLVLDGTAERLPALAIGGLATALLLVPILFVGPVAGLEIAYPLAAAVVGGLVSTVVVSVLVLPALYARFGDVGDVGSTEVSVERLVDLTGYEVEPIREGQ